MNWFMKTLKAQTEVSLEQADRLSDSTGFCFVSQAKVSNLSSAVIVIRVMRDLCKRVPDWSPLSEWVRNLFLLFHIRAW